MSSTLSTSTLDSCNVQVTVRELRPLPTGPSTSRHYADVAVVIGTMLVGGLAAFDESQAGVLVLAGAPASVEYLPMEVQEVLNDLGSATVAARVREAIEAAVQQYDLDKGVLGDGPEEDPEWREWVSMRRGVSSLAPLFSNPELAARVASLTRTRTLAEDHARKWQANGFVAELP